MAVVQGGTVVPPNVMIVDMYIYNTYIYIYIPSVIALCSITANASYIYIDFTNLANYVAKPCCNPLVIFVGNPSYDQNLCGFPVSRCGEPRDHWLPLG